MPLCLLQFPFPKKFQTHRYASVCYVSLTYLSAQRIPLASCNKFNKEENLGRRTRNISWWARHATPSFCRTQRLTSTFTTDSHNMLSWIRRKKSILSQNTLLRSVLLFSSQLQLNFPLVLSLLYITTYYNSVGIFHLSKLATYPAHLFLNDNKPISYYGALHCTVFSSFM
jgi:hypothetical protein